jgi:hypothetical protein
MSTEPGTLDRSARAVLRDALSRLPSPSWTVEQSAQDLVFFEMSGERHGDRLGYRRLLACGGALETAWTALRVLGHDLAVDFPDDPLHPDQFAVLHLVGIRPPTSREFELYTAIRYLAEPAPGEPMRPVADAVLDRIATTGLWPETALEKVQAS